MFNDLPDILLRHRRIVGLAAIAVAIVTWGVDWAGLVYHCPYCRKARQALDELQAENAAYRGVAVEWIEEQRQIERLLAAFASAACVVADPCAWPFWE